MIYRMTAGAGLVGALIACTPASDISGRALFMDHCTACHGADGTGGGPSAASLDVRVPDLTLIAARNGGVFPMAEVMSQIDGYTRARRGDISMPEFGLVLQEGPLVLYDSGDGIVSPTPARLVEVAEYLRAIQVDG